jgi:glutathione S-transferase
VEENWRIFRDAVLGGIASPMRRVIGPLARRGVRRQLKGHGIGLHSADEIHAIGRRDIGAIADFLADKPFLMGESVTGIDATAYGMLANIMNVPITSPVKEEGSSRPNLAAYVARIGERYFG